MLTAEGEFFRTVVREACERCRIPVFGFRERELDEHANPTFGKASAGVRQCISDLRRTVGFTMDTGREDCRADG